MEVTNDYGSLYHSVARHLICSGTYTYLTQVTTTNAITWIYVITCTYIHACMNVACELWRLMHDLEEA